MVKMVGDPEAEMAGYSEAEMVGEMGQPKYF
jgi:hypothetical protein